MPVRVPIAALVLVGGLTLGVVAVAVLGAGRPSAKSASARAEPAPSRALEVLRSWDERRADAWAAGDVRRLRELYTPGSTAGSADAALLARYRARGLVVRGLRMQVLGARVLVSRPSTVRLVVTDRLAGARAVGADGRARALPVTAAVTRDVLLRRVDGTWRVARVSVVG